MTSVGRYSKVEHETQPRSVRPPGTITFAGGGWKMSVPVVVITALIAALSAHLVDKVDPNLGRLETQMQIRELRDEQHRANMQRDVQAIREQLTAGNNELRNRMTVLEEQMKQIRK